MFAKQIPNGRLLPKKVWHIPSLADELYNGPVSPTSQMTKRRLFVDLSRQPETPKYGEISRVKCSIWDTEMDEQVASGFQITNQNNKKSIEIINWDIPTNAEYIFSYVKEVYAIDENKAKNHFDILVKKWNIPDANFEKDILTSLLKDKAIVQSILFNLEKFIVPLFDKYLEFDDETKFESYIVNSLSKLGYELPQGFSDGGSQSLFKQVWDEYGLNEQGNVIKTNKWGQTFSSIFLDLKEEIHHKRIKERSNSGVSSQHMTKWGPMSEPEGDGWED